MPTTSNPRLLIIKLGAIGDVLMAVPAARAMQERGYQIDWLCGESVAPLLSLYPWINTIPIDEKALLKAGKLTRLRTIARIWRTLSGKKYDLIATLYYDRRYKLLTLPIRAARKLTLSHTDRATTLIPGRHHTDEYARILSGRPDGETPHQLAPIHPETIPPTAFPPDPARTRIVLAPAGARNLLRDDALRRWPIELYVQLAQLLLARGFEVILLGGPDDAWASPAFTALPVTDLIGKLTLVESLSLLDSAAVAITHDTGPLHLAGIASCAIVTIFGPTDPHGRLPQRPNCVALWGGEGFACRPCYDGRDYPPCPNNGCVQQVTPSMVLSQIEELLAAIREGRELPPRILVPPHTSLLSSAKLSFPFAPSASTLLAEERL